jgi:hypothetical protein
MPEISYPGFSYELSAMRYHLIYWVCRFPPHGRPWFGFFWRHFLELGSAQVFHFPPLQAAFSPALKPKTPHPELNKIYLTFNFKP